MASAVAPNAHPRLLTAIRQPMNRILTVAAALLLAGCSPVLRSTDVKDWPLKSATAQITCNGQQPIKAKLDNGVTYALNGTTATREGLKPLDWDSGQFLPHQDPTLRALGIELALLTSFNAAAEKACQQE